MGFALSGTFEYRRTKARPKIEACPDHEKCFRFRWDHATRELHGNEWWGAEFHMRRSQVDDIANAVRTFEWTQSHGPFDV